MGAIDVISIFTGLSFIVYGINSFIANRMISEFERWGLADKRQLIGAAQFIAGIGVLVGLKSDLMLILSALFIMIMMLVAIMVRIKIKDNISDILPAIAYILLSIVILYDRICL